MEKKRKNEQPTPTAQSGGEPERKKTRRAKDEGADASSKEPERIEKQLQGFTGQAGDGSEANVKLKMGLGTKRTKKPPKSLENFICRPPIRVSQKPGPAVGDGTRAKSKGSNQLRHPAQNKPASDSLATKTSLSTASTKENPSTPSPSSLTPSTKASPPPDSSNNTSAKRVLPRQSRKANSNPEESTPEEPPSATQPQASMPVSQRKTSRKQISAPSSPAHSQQEPSTQENSMKAENTVHHGPSNGSPSDTRERSCKGKPAPPKQTRSRLPKSDSKTTANNNNTEMSSNVNLNSKRKERKASRSPNNNSGSRTSENGCLLEKSSPLASDQPENLLAVQVTSSSSPSKCTGHTLEDSSRVTTKGQNEQGDLGKTVEITMKSSQAVPVPEQQQQKCGSTEGLPNDDHREIIQHCPDQEQIKSLCLSDTDKNVTGSVLNPQISPTSAEQLQAKKRKKPSNKEKRRHCSKTAKMTNKNSQRPVACTSGLQGSSPQKDLPKASPSLQCEQKLPGQSPTSQLTSEISPDNNPRPRKRGRPKVNKLEGLLQEKNLPESANNQSQDPEQEPDGKHQKRSATAGKRGRPKRCFSVQSQSTQPVVTSSKQYLKETGDQLKEITEEKVKDTQQKCRRSNKVMMKTIIRKINKMKVKRKDQVLSQILLGQKQRNNKELPQEDSRAAFGSRVSPDKHSLSSLVTSFGGKLGSQINVSKRGTIYMGKRRGRKPKCEKNSAADSMQVLPSPHSQQEFTSNTTRQSLGSQTGAGILKNDSSSYTPGRSSQINVTNQKVKAASFIPLGEFQNPKTREPAFSSSSGEGVLNDINTLDRNVRHSSSRSSASTGLPSVSASGSHRLFTGVSEAQGIGSLKGKSKSLSHFPSEQNRHLSSTQSPSSSGRTQDSSGAQVADPTLTFPNQEGHKFKCHRRGHHCIGRDKLRRHKYKCKKKCMQLRAKRQDPDFLAEVEDLVVRLREIHIVHHIPSRARLEDDGNAAGRKSAKSKSQSHDLQCLQEEVHPPTMFQINFSGYYSPHSTLSCDPLHYVRMANMKRKHGCSSEPSEQIVTHFPVMHKLGYPVSGGGFFHPSYKLPFTTASLGFGLYRGYPSAPPLYPSSFPSSYVHHYSKNPIISPSKFHKKKAKVSKQDSGGLWGGKSVGSYPRMTPSFSCDCFTRQPEATSCQREKPRDKTREGRDEHGRTRGREQDIEWLLWQNKLSKDNKSTASPFSVFSSVQNKEKTFPSNVKQTREVRWSEHQPPWPRMREFASKPGGKRVNREFTSHDREDTPEEAESDGELAETQHSSTRTQSFLKQPILFSSTQRQRRVRKRNGVTSASTLFREQNGTPLEDFSSLADKGVGYVQAGSQQFPDQSQVSNSSTSREPENTPRELKGHRSNRTSLIQDDERDRARVQSLAHFMQEHTQPDFKHSRNTARAKLTQRFRLSTARNPEGLKVTAGNEVKRRGRGRPRKNPPPSPRQRDSSPPSLIPAPPVPLPPPEQTEHAGTAGGAKGQGDSMLEVIKAVVHREQRKRIKKRRSAEDEREKGQNVRDGKDRTETSDLHTSPAPTAPSPDHTAPEDTEAEVDSQSEETSAFLPTKQYLWAGLYSDAYKTEDIVEPQPLSTDCLEYVPDEHEHGLLPAPFHVGKYLRMKRIDFQLPYDIHWFCAHNKVFETPGNPPPPLTCNDSCRAIKDSTAQYSTEDCPHTRLPDSSKEADVLQLQEEDESSLQILQQQEEGRDSEDFPSPLSSKERTFVMEHGVFLVRNYEKMRARQALLLMREGVGEREEEEDGGSREETSAQTGPGVCVAVGLCLICEYCCKKSIHLFS